MKRFAFLTLVATQILIACVAPAPPTVVVEMPTPLPTATVPTNSTAIPTIPEPTPSLIPASTVAPSLTPSATLEGRLGPDTFPPDINPLTGLPADVAALVSLPINVKVSNSPPCVRPQYGLAQADVIFEHYVEAWVTRFTAIFHSHYPTRVGSVRSARLIDIELPAIFGSGFLFSGASAGGQRRIDGSDFVDRAFHALDGCPVLCRVPRESTLCNERTHTLFANTQAGLELFAERGFTGPQLPLTGWVFSTQPPATGLPATQVDVDYLNAPVRWTYDSTTGLYYRAQSGTAHTDAETGLTLTAANVVVLFANHVYSDIQESTNWYSLEIQFWDSGPGLMFRDGQAFELTWVRQQRPGLFALVDANNNPVPLKPGRTWFQMVGLASSQSQTDGRWTIDPEELPLRTPPRRP